MTEGNTKVVTRKVRLGYPNLFEPRASSDKQEPKYSVEILIPKTDTATVEKIRAAQNAAATSEKGKKALGDQVPTWGAANFPHKKWGDTLRDGDDPEENDGHEERSGHWFISARASTKFKPAVVDQGGNKVENESTVYGGVYGRVSMTAFAYDMEGKKGVSFGLNSVQTFNYGEPFGAPREDASEIFDDGFEDEGPDDLL